MTPNPILQPTPEQAAIIAAARTTSDNLLVNALAGAAKTSTLVMLVKAMPVAPILSLAFNKKIATEMAERMPGHVQCSTMNALGHRSWQGQVGKLTVKADKIRSHVTDHIKSLPRAKAGPWWDCMAALCRSISMAKHGGVLPEDFQPDFLDDDVTLPANVATDFIQQTLVWNIETARMGLIDFDDQIYMPTLFNGVFPSFPLVLVDEAQDLSALNHKMLRKIVRKRLIAVGDPFQSIYGFRGAVANGMSALKSDFKMHELGLSVTFRCPKALVRRAQGRVSHFKWAENAIDGEIIDCRIKAENWSEAPHKLEDYWTPSSIPDGAAIICRNNAPLFSTALELLRNGRGINLVGSDIGPQLLKALKSLGPTSLEREAVHDEINSWETSRIKRKPSSEAATRDRADCLRVFADAGRDLGEALVFAERLFASEGPIQLLTGHKAKGLEWDTVYHLDPWRVPGKWVEPGTEAWEQELNIRYVIETRAKRRLILVNAEDL